MQFYLIFPILAFVRTKLTSAKFIILLSLLFILSFVYQHTRTNQTESYEFLFSRLWQFVIGIGAGSVTVETKQKYLHLALILVLIPLFFPIQLPVIFLNIVVMITGAIIAASSASITPFFSFFNLPYLDLIGEVSYIIYLLHWPLITYMRYSSEKSQLSIFGSFIPRGPPRDPSLGGKQSNFKGDLLKDI